MSRNVICGNQKSTKEKLIVRRNRSAKDWYSLNNKEKKRVANDLFERGYQQYLKSMKKTNKTKDNN